MEGFIIGTCQHQVIDQTASENLFLCIVYKDYFRFCPSKCHYRSAGSPLSFDRLYRNNYDFECTYFHSLVQCTTNDNQSFICELTGHVPDCPNCPLKVTSNPSTNSSQST